jgi:predicted methyltransferase
LMNSRTALGIWLALVTAALCSVPACASRNSAEHLTAELSAAGRPADDVARDAGRKPGEVLAFLGVDPGMTVLDLIAAGGYYSEALSVAVGPKGRVYAQNPPFVLKIRDGANEKAISARLAGDRLPNVTRVNAELADLATQGIAPGSVDVAMTALNFHDIYNRGGPDAASAFLASVFALLEPGGVLGIIDHVGAPDGDNEKLHRIDPALVVAVVEASPFELDGTSDVLENPADDHSEGVFAPGVRGETDRFVMKLRRPR